MAGKKQTKSIEIVSPELLSNPQAANVQFIRGSVQGREALITVTMLDEKPIESASKANPYDTLAQCQRVVRTRTGGYTSVGLRIGDDLSVQVRVSKHRPEMDTRPARQADKATDNWSLEELLS